MDITAARRIGDLVNNHKFKGFTSDITAAVQVLQTIGNEADRDLAKVIAVKAGDVDQQPSLSLGAMIRIHQRDEPKAFWHGTIEKFWASNGGLTYGEVRDMRIDLERRGKHIYGGGAIPQSTIYLDVRLDSRDRAERFMHNQLRALRLNWEVPGPTFTKIDWLQCWQLPTEMGGRLVMVQVYKDGNGFEVFPQIMTMGLKETAAVVGGLSIIEEDPGGL